MTVQELIDQLEEIKALRASAKDYDVRVLGFNVLGARIVRIKINALNTDEVVEIRTSAGEVKYG